LVSLFPISIAVVPLYSAYLCVSVCVSMFFVCVLLLFFSDCRIYPFSSLAARVFNKLTRYSLGLTKNKSNLFHSGRHRDRLGNIECG